jgi:hypothetical protein
MPDGTGEFLSDGAKIRNLFVVPDADKRNFFYGVNFELGYELPQFSPTPWVLEIRPIIGIRRRLGQLQRLAVDRNDTGDARRRARALGHDPGAPATHAFN